MSDDFGKTPDKISWKTPVLTEASISDVTLTYVRPTGIDNYEASNPAEYGS